MTDLYDTEGTGHFLGATFMNRPVVGGHFAFLTLKRACGGLASEGLKFLEERDDEGEKEKKGLLFEGKSDVGSEL